MTPVRSIHEASSFKDPDGFVFYKRNTVYRQINTSYLPHYRRLMDSGLYTTLIEHSLLIPHKKSTLQPITDSGACVIKPKKIPYITYPYEWSFSMLKDAALVTLDVLRHALSYNITLKDASAYNVQFFHARPVFIDTLSFANHDTHTPWNGYRQFCRHFLAPLAMAAYGDIHMFELLRTNIDGIPLDTASRMLPKRTYLNPGLFMHIHMHARAEQTLAGYTSQGKARNFSSVHALSGLIESLTRTVTRLTWKFPHTQWGNYKEMASYSKSSLEHKKHIIEQFLSTRSWNTLWDIGANTGLFSMLSRPYAASILANDVDPVAIEKLYLHIRNIPDNTITPMVHDIRNPSPNIGWNNSERVSLASRGPCDVALALALIHHITVSHNISFMQSAGYFSKLCRFLIIEYVPKSDPQTQTLLAVRNDIFSAYTQKAFEHDYTSHFRILKKVSIKGSKRTLYLMKTRS